MAERDWEGSKEWRLCDWLVSLLFFEIKSIDFFILLLGFGSSILGFPGAQKDTMLDTQASCWKVSMLSAHQ